MSLQQDNLEEKLSGERKDDKMQATYQTAHWTEAPKIYPMRKFPLW
jgi:hypothetical protein